MELVKQVTPSVAEVVKYMCAGTFVATSEQLVKLETTPNGEEHCLFTVPEGKTWNVNVRFDIDES